MDSPRYLAVKALERRFDASFPFDRFYATQPFQNLSLQDQALTKALVAGVCRNLSALDFLIRCVSRRPLNRIDPIIRWILRAGIYQLRFMRVPDHAAVHDSVELCRSFRKASATSFVNASLRTLLRDRPELPDDESVESLAIRFSHPDWLVRRYLNRMDRKTVLDLLQRNNQVPEAVVWVNHFRTTVNEFLEELSTEGIPAQRLEGLEGAVRIGIAGFHLHRSYRDGRCFFMDAASQKVAYWPELVGFRTIGDVCFAPGGKSLILMSRADPEARLICSDSNRRRIQEGRSRFRFLGVTEPDLVQADLTYRGPWASRFDFILADVPCSGLGTLASNPEIRWFVREEDLMRHHERQVLILRNAFACLRPGGELLYSTCSTEPEENEQVVEEFAGIEPSSRVDPHYFRTSPASGDGGGFFGARVRRFE